MLHVHPRQRMSETGGITIVVSLMMLALLTVAVIGMSRNSMRETMVLAAAREAADIRQLADTGVEWSIQWMDPKAWPTQAALDAANQNPLVAQLNYIVDNPELGGRVLGVPSAAAASMLLPTRSGDVSGISRTFDLQVSYMGRLPITDTSQMDQRLYPLIWMLRSKGSETIPGGMTFSHNREAWISTPIPEVR